MFVSKRFINCKYFIIIIIIIIDNYIIIIIISEEKNQLEINSYLEYENTVQEYYNNLSLDYLIYFDEVSELYCRNDDCCYCYRCQTDEMSDKKRQKIQISDEEMNQLEINCYLHSAAEYENYYINLSLEYQCEEEADLLVEGYFYNYYTYK